MSLQVFSCFLVGGIFLGNAANNFQFFSAAVTSARDVFGIIERVRAILFMNMTDYALFTTADSTQYVFIV